MARAEPPLRCSAAAPLESSAQGPPEPSAVTTGPPLRTLAACRRGPPGAGDWREQGRGAAVARSGGAAVAAARGVDGEAGEEASLPPQGGRGHRVPSEAGGHRHDTAPHLASPPLQRRPRGAAAGALPLGRRRGSPPSRRRRWSPPARPPPPEPSRSAAAAGALRAAVAGALRAAALESSRSAAAGALRVAGAGASRSAAALEPSRSGAALAGRRQSPLREPPAPRSTPPREPLAPGSTPTIPSLGHGAGTSYLCVAWEGAGKIGPVNGSSVGGGFGLPKTLCRSKNRFGSPFASPVGDSLNEPSCDWWMVNWLQFR